MQNVYELEYFIGLNISNKKCKIYCPLVVSINPNPNTAMLGMSTCVKV